MRFSLFISALLLAALPGKAAEISSHRLANGLDIVVLEDHRAPVVVHMVWYRVGAADEPPGKSGIAHFLEHLLFKGTDDLEAGELSETVALNGGSDNAFTSWDYTAYFQRVAADRLELMMQMEADRMRDLEMTEDDVATELQVILEERSQRVDGDPGALFTEQREAAQYLNHPYGIPIIGWRHEMEQLSRQDAFEFYQRYYAPNNAILIVAGDVHPENVFAMAERQYAHLQPTPDLPVRMRPQEPPHLSPRRLTLEDPRVGQDYVLRTYLAPERDEDTQHEAAALTLLAATLGGNSATSVLGQRLQFEEKKAVYASAFYNGVNYDDTTFGLVIVPVPDVSLEEAEAALDQAVSDFLEEGIDEAQFERIKMQLRASMIYAEDNIENMARRFGVALTSGLTLADIDAWPDLLQATSSEDVMEAAHRIFAEQNSVTGYLMAPSKEANQ